jgi:hypothetical protein
MADSARIGALLTGLIVPLLALGVVVHATVLLVAIIALALVALFAAGLALGRERPRGK